MKRLLTSAAVAATVFSFGGVAQAADPVRVTHVNTLTGALEAYGRQLSVGIRMGIAHATNGTGMVNGRTIEIKEVDDQLNPARARALVEAAYAEDNADIVVGPIASGIALAVLPLAEEYERIIMPEGVADAITGASWNRYVVRVTRNSSQDAISNAVAVGKPGVCVSTIAQDYAFGRDGVAAYKEALANTGARIAREEYLPTDATDFTAAAQRLFDSLRDARGCDEGKFIFGIWAGASNPFGAIQDLQPERFGIKMTTGGNILPALVGYAAFPGMEGATYYYYESPNNPINDKFVADHFAAHNAPPDFFTAQGFAEGVSIVEAVRKAGGKSDAESLIKAYQGLEFQTPKGRMVVRKEDHQTLQSMYHFRIVVEERNNWFPDRTVTAGVPQLVREITLEEMDIPIRNK